MLSFTARQALRWFLYGRDEVPSNFEREDLIRPENARSATTIDMQAHMNAEGRYALPSMSPLVQAFFADNPPGGQSWYEWASTSPSASYVDEAGNIVFTLSGMMSALGKDNLITVQHWYYRDESESLREYVERVLVYNTASYRLVDQNNMRFVISPTGERFISNLTVRAQDDDFDFVSNSFLANITAPFVRPMADPSKIGRVVDMAYRGEVAPIDAAYTIQDFQNDNDLFSDRVGRAVTSLPAAATELAALLVDVFGDGISKFVGTNDRPVFYGSDGNDDLNATWIFAPLLELRKANGVILFGGKGNDTLTGTSSNDEINGGADCDTVRIFEGMGSVLRQRTISATLDRKIRVDSADAGTDLLHRVERIQTLSIAGGRQEVDISSLRGQVDLDPNCRLQIRGDAGTDQILMPNRAAGVSVSSLSPRAFDPNDTVDFSGKVIQIADLDGTSVVEAVNFEELVLTGHRDEVHIKGGDVDNLQSLDAGGGNDLVNSTVVNLNIYLGSGNDALINAGAGSVVHTGDGNDKINIGNNILIADASENDKLGVYGIEIHGALKAKGTESPWADDGLARYAINVAGDLVIENRYGQQTFVANYVGGPGAPFNTAGIYLGEIATSAYRLMDFPDGAGSVVNGWFEYLKAWMKAYAPGVLWSSSDPLVFDLDGDGLELTAQTYVAPLFDMDGDLFGERTGWVRPDDGVLVLDGNSNGLVDNIDELFGGRGVSGFAELATHDANEDDVIDANDAVYAQLRMWTDLDGDAAADAGELKTLSELGIASINLDSTPQTGVTNAGNVISATATFTRTDQTTGTVSDVNFRIDNFRSQYLGDTTVSAAAAALPNVKGRGTLADLHVAMTLDPTLIPTVEATLPNLATHDLAALRSAAMPILAGWARAVRLPDGQGNLVVVDPAQHLDVPILLEDGPDGQAHVTDFAYRVVDAQGEYWLLASGDDVLDGQGQPILRPTFQNILDQQPAEGSWDVFDGTEIGFLERYLGETLSLGEQPANVGTAFAGATQAIDSAWSLINVTVVRLAIQGPLASYFPGVEYDAAADVFRPTTDEQLVPAFEAIFDAAPGTAQGASDWLATWKPLLRVVMGDFDRGEGRLVTHSFVFSTVLAAAENTDLALSPKDAAVVLGVPGDLIVTGTGTITGSSDADIFYMTAGDQTAKGGAGPDAYVFGEDFGSDVIDDVEAALTQHHSDMIRFAHVKSDEVTLTRDGLDLIISVNGTDDQIRVKRQFEGRLPSLFSDDVSEETGIREIVFADGVVWTTWEIARAVAHPNSTNETLTGTPDTDVLDGGGGNDSLSGGDESDIYVFGTGYGDDTIDEQATNILINGPDFVEFGAGLSADDITFHRNGNSNDLEIQINGTSDSLTIRDQFSAAYTGVLSVAWFDRIEILSFEDGSYFTWDQVMEKIVADGKTAGDDTIYGFSWEDMLDGGTGNDFLSGGNENDTYIFGLGYGQDTIDEQLGNILSGMDDTVRFASDVDPETVTLERDGNSANLRIVLADGSTLTIVDQFSAAETGVFGLQWFDRIEQFVFGSDPETIWTHDDIMDRLLDRYTTAGNDSVYGFHRDDLIDAGTGDDFLQGADGDDTYVFGLGYGHDTINDGQGNVLVDDDDTVEFGAGIDVEDVQISRVGHDLVVDIAGTSDRLTIQNQFFFNTLDHSIWRIENFEFADESVWSAVALTMRSSSGDDYMAGDQFANEFDGGAGNDMMEGFSGGDTYHFGLGSGQDIVYDDDSSLYTTTDRIVLGAGITTSNIRLSRGGTYLLDLIIEVEGSPNDRLTVKDHFRFQSWSIERIEFADGTVWLIGEISNRVIGPGTPGDDTKIGDDLPNILEGLGGNDTLDGGRGSDTYIYTRGDGNDTITEAPDSGTADRLVLHGIVPGAVTLVRNGPDVTLVIAESAAGAGDGGSLLLKNELDDFYWRGVEQIAFDDGTVWTQADLRTMLITNAGTNGNDTITGSNGSDIISGGLGNDTLNGGTGSDTYIYRRGDGNDTITEAADGGTADRLVLQGISPSAVTLVRNGLDVTLVIAESSPGAGDGGSILLKIELDEFYDRGVEQITFDDGTVWTRADLRTMLLAQAGTAGNDTITGFNVADTITGGAGNDTLDGVQASDTYVYSRGDGNDTIIEATDNGTADKLVLHDINPSAVALVRNGLDATLVIAESSPGAGDGGSILLKIELDEFYDRGVEQITFDNGTVWTRADLRTMLLVQAATAGNDTITGFNVADTITGGAGNDTLDGVQGSDTYVYSRGDGSDIITEAAENGIADKLVLHGIAPSAVTLVRNGLDATLVIAESSPGAGDGGSILLKTELDEFYDRGVEQITFDDGTVWTRADLRAMLLAQAGTAGNDTIIGFNADDRLNGGAGNDRLEGITGNDTYVFGSGFGQDTIYDTGGGTDAVEFGAGILPTGLTIYRAGANNLSLMVQINGTADRFALQDHYHASGSYRIEQFRFADGTIWNAAAIDANLGSAPYGATRAGTFNAETLTGTSGSDIFFGDRGNDSYTTAAGSDTFVYRSGDGTEFIDEESGSTSEIDTLKFVDLNPSDIMVSRVGTDVIIRDNVTGQTIEDDQHFWSMSANYGLDRIEFADGTVWDRTRINQEAWYRGSTGNDTITASAWSDTVFGDLGNDTINTEGGNDLVIYRAGDGNDVVYDSGTSTSETDTLRLVDLNLGDVTLSRSGHHLKIGINATGQTIESSFQFYSATQFYGFERLEFADGTFLNRTDIDNAAGTWQVGTSSANTQTGAAKSDTLMGNGGNDTLSGLGAADLIDGGDGNDTITGGTGSDYLVGGAGDDNYTFAAGDGLDRIDNRDASSTNDRLTFGSGIDHDELWLQQAGDDLLISVMGSSADKVRIQGWFGQTSGQTLDKLLAGDNWTLGESQVQQLVNAMASFTGEGSDPAVTYHNNLPSSVQTAIAAAWQQPA